MLRGSDFYDFLFVNSIHSNIKYCFFSIKLIHTIIIREGYGYFYFISWGNVQEDRSCRQTLYDRTDDL